MSYEQEQKQYREQLDKVNARIKILESLFLNAPHLKRRYGLNRVSAQEEYLMMILKHNYGDYSVSDDSIYMLEYKLCQYQKKELEYKLRESRTERNVSKTFDFIDGIIPRHVHGRIYEVKDKDGCGTFSLYFLIIGAIITFIISLFNGGL